MLYLILKLITNLDSRVTNKMAKEVKSKWNGFSLKPRKAMPEGFQRAEFMLEHGFVDMIVERKNLRSEIARLIDYCEK